MGRERARVERRVRGLLAGHGPDEFSTELANTAHDANGPGVPHSLGSWLERRGVRIDPGRRGAAAIALLVVVVAAITAWWVLVERPRASPITASSTTASASAPSSGSLPAGSARASPTAVVVVDVVGKVHRTGVYELPAGSRVSDALEAAGGALPGLDLTALNLARKVADGEQIAVGVTGAATSGGAVGSLASGASGSASGPVDLNSATAEQLDALPGVGPVLSQNILDWRSAHGRFDSVDQLREVSGIGPSKFATLRPLVTV
jgi:competence protein ComEA